MTLVAIEEHWMLPELTSALQALPPPLRDESLAFNERDDTAGRLADLDAGRIAAMDAAGIDLAVLALTPPGTQPLPPGQAVALSRTANDLAAAAVDRHRSRFRALSTLPLSAPEQVAAELERAAGLGHVGTMVYGRAGDRFLDDPAYEDFFATAARLGQPVFIHPQLPSPALRDASYRGFDPLTELALATFGWGWHLDAGLAALRLILRGTFDRHPDLQVVLGHWGEMLLFWLDRADSLARVGRPAAAGVGLPAVELLHHHLRHAQPRPAAPCPVGDGSRPADLLHGLPVPAADPGGDRSLPGPPRVWGRAGQVLRRQRRCPVRPRSLNPRTSETGRPPLTAGLRQE